MPDQIAPLVRKIAASRSREGDGGLDPARAFDLSFARVAERTMGLALRVTRGAEVRATPAEGAELMPDHGLYLLLDGPKGALGLAVLTQDALAALTGMLMLGRAAPRPPEPRRPTRTDAALASEMLDLVLAELDPLIAAEEAAPWLTGFRFGSHLPDGRALGVLLEEPCYRLWRLSLAFAAGEDTLPGDMLVVLPEAGRGPERLREAGHDPVTHAPANLSAADWSHALERAVLPATAGVEAVLSRITLPLADLLRLDRGMVLTLGEASLGALRIEGEGGTLVAEARLGQGGGRRAARIATAEAGEEGEVPLPLGPTPGRLILPFELPHAPGEDWAADAAADHAAPRAGNEATSDGANSKAATGNEAVVRERSAS